MMCSGLLCQVGSGQPCYLNFGSSQKWQFFMYILKDEKYILKIFQRAYNVTLLKQFGANPALLKIEMAVLLFIVFTVHSIDLHEVSHIAGRFQSAFEFQVLRSNKNTSYAFDQSTSLFRPICLSVHTVCVRSSVRHKIFPPFNKCY